MAAEPPSLILDDTAIAALSDKELGSLSEQLIEDVVKQLVALAGTSPELLDEVRISPLLQAQAIIIVSSIHLTMLD